MSLVITTPWLSMGTVGVAYTHSLTATGGTPAYTWAVVGGVLPAGLSLNSAGTFSGTPTYYGLWTFQVQVTDSVGATVTGNMQLSINPVPMTLITALADQYSNSYIETGYADVYWSQHYNAIRAAAWSALSSNQKVASLIHACRVLETARFTCLKTLRKTLPHRYDRHSRLVMTLEDQPMPTKWLWTQRLQFPRNLDFDFNTGGLYIPEPMMMAQCEQAVYLLTFDDTAIANRLQGVTEDVTYVGNIHLRQNYVQSGSQFAPAALELIRPYLLSTSAEVRRA